MVERQAVNAGVPRRFAGLSLVVALFLSACQPPPAKREQETATTNAPRDVTITGPQRCRQGRGKPSAKIPDNASVKLVKVHSDMTLELDSSRGVRERVGLLGIKWPEDGPRRLAARAAVEKFFRRFVYGHRLMSDRADPCMAGRAYRLVCVEGFIANDKDGAELWDELNVALLKAGNAEPGPGREGAPDWRTCDPIEP